MVGRPPTSTLSPPPPLFLLSPRCGPAGGRAVTTDGTGARDQPLRRDLGPGGRGYGAPPAGLRPRDRKSTRLNSSHANISYAVFCLKKKTEKRAYRRRAHRLD